MCFELSLHKFHITGVLKSKKVCPRSARMTFETGVYTVYIAGETPSGSMIKLSAFFPQKLIYFEFILQQCGHRKQTTYITRTDRDALTQYQPLGYLIPNF